MQQDTTNDKVATMLLGPTPHTDTATAPSHTHTDRAARSKLHSPPKLAPPLVLPATALMRVECHHAGGQNTISPGVTVKRSRPCAWAYSGYFSRSGSNGSTFSLYILSVCMYVSIYFM